jgi:8-oxo-dGTP pyrophosphatase MutT (NUDIX family)
MGYRLAHRLRGWHYARSGKTVEGCSILARDKEGRFLLVRHSYGPEVWAFPGGGIGKHETALVAASREFREELGCSLANIKRVSLDSEMYLGATNIVHIFTGIVQGRPRADQREIVEARFFDRDSFPPNLSSTVKRRMQAFDSMPKEKPSYRGLKQV